MNNKHELIKLYLQESIDNHYLKMIIGGVKDYIRMCEDYGTDIYWKDIIAMLDYKEHYKEDDDIYE